MIHLTAKLGEIYDIEHNKGSKIYPQIKLMPTMPLKHKCLSIIRIWVIVSHKWKWSINESKKKKKKKKKTDFFFLNWENRDGIGKKVAILDWEMEPKFGP